MLKIIAVLFVLGLIGCLIGWIKDHSELIIGIIVLVVIVLIGCAILPTVLKIGLSVLPTVLPILFLLLVIGGIYFYAMKSRSKAYLTWLKGVGIGSQTEAPGDEHIWKWARDNKYAIALERDLVLSGEFRDLVMGSINQGKIVTEKLIETYCLRSAPSFQANNITLFLDYLQKSGMVFPLCEHGEETVYLSSALKDNCERMFEREGAATKDEFAAICGAASVDAAAKAAPQTIAETFLRHMLAHEVVHKVELPDLGEDLYVSNSTSPNSKLVRREVSID